MDLHAYIVNYLGDRLDVAPAAVISPDQSFVVSGDDVGGIFIWKTPEDAVASMTEDATALL